MPTPLQNELNKKNMKTPYSASVIGAGTGRHDPALRQPATIGSYIDKQKQLAPDLFKMRESDWAIAADVGRKQQAVATDFGNMLNEQLVKPAINRSLERSKTNERERLGGTVTPGSAIMTPFGANQASIADVGVKPALNKSLEANKTNERERLRETVTPASGAIMMPPGANQASIVDVGVKPSVASPASQVNKQPKGKSTAQLSAERYNRNVQALPTMSSSDSSVGKIERPNYDGLFKNVTSAVGYAMASNFAKDLEGKYRFDTNQDTRAKQREVSNKRKDTKEAREGSSAKALDAFREAQARSSDMTTDLAEDKALLSEELTRSQIARNTVLTKQGAIPRVGTKTKKERQGAVRLTAAKQYNELSKALSSAAVQEDPALKKRIMNQLMSIEATLDISPDRRNEELY